MLASNSSSSTSCSSTSWSPESLFVWKGSSHLSRSRQAISRPPEVLFRIAHITDLHIPGELDLTHRLRDLFQPYQPMGHYTHRLSAFANTFGHLFRSERHRYFNLIKKALVGLHACGVDHLACTGDITHCGLGPEFIQAEAILSLTQWDSPELFTVVPGNHDRFNLYDDLRSDSMEDRFDVVMYDQPRVKKLPHGIALLEIDSNRPKEHYMKHLEAWLPNTIGVLSPATLDWIRSQRDALRGWHLVCLLHHHLTDDWYPVTSESMVSGLMDPAEGSEELVDAVCSIDPEALFLHGHKHEIMPIDYTWNGHRLSCPGGFAEHQTLNLIDYCDHGGVELTQVQLVS